MSRPPAHPPSALRRLAVVIAFAGVSLVFLTPVLWMVLSSLRPPGSVDVGRLNPLPRITVLDDLQRQIRGADDLSPEARAELERQLQDERTRRAELDAEQARVELELGAIRIGAREGDAAALERRLDEIEAERDIELAPRDGAYWRALGGTAQENYGAVWNDPGTDFPLYLKNSLIVATLSVLGMVLSSAIVAYGFARIRWRGRNALFILVLATMMIPFPVLMAPLYILFKQWGWIGTFLPLWVPACFGGAFSIFLLRQFFLTIPRELDEAAMIDGCTHFGIFWRIIMPLSKPALVVVALFQFIASWNDFVGPLIFLNHQEKFTLALGLFMYQSQHGGTPWNLVMAASTVIVVPVLILFLVAQRAFVEGVATGGVKG